MSLKDLFFSFNGRILRKDWWIVIVTMHVLMVFAVGIAAAFLVGGATATISLEENISTMQEDMVNMQGDASMNPMALMIASIIIFASVIAFIWSFYAACVKRYHDHDKSGLWALVSLIPTIGTVWILIECGCLPGTEGDNQFGAAPKG